MFEPTTLPTDRSGCPPTAAMTLTTSSGSEVPAATTVSPITAGVRPATRASATAPRTRSSPPAASTRRPSSTRPSAVSTGFAREWGR